jgi:hypothetical protein
VYSTKPRNEQTSRKRQIWAELCLSFAERKGLRSLCEVSVSVKAGCGSAQTVGGGLGHDEPNHLRAMLFAIGRWSMLRQALAALEWTMTAGKG